MFRNSDTKKRFLCHCFETNFEVPVSCFETRFGEQIFLFRNKNAGKMKQLFRNNWFFANLCSQEESVGYLTGVNFGNFVFFDWLKVCFRSGRSGRMICLENVSLRLCQWFESPHHFWTKSSFQSAKGDFEPNWGRTQSVMKIYWPGD